MRTIDKNTWLLKAGNALRHKDYFFAYDELEALKEQLWNRPRFAKKTAEECVSITFWSAINELAMIEYLTRCGLNFHKVAPDTLLGKDALDEDKKAAALCDICLEGQKTDIKVNETAADEDYKAHPGKFDWAIYPERDDEGNYTGNVNVKCYNTRTFFGYYCDDVNFDDIRNEIILKY